MHKPRNRNKKIVRGSGTPAPYGTRGPIIVKDLLASVGSMRRELDRVVDRRAFWMGFLREQLPPTLAAEVTDVQQEAGLLRVSASSAAWSSRLKFALAEIWAEARLRAPELDRLVVRVKPREGAAGPSPEAR
jgi:hypothetical protein